MRNAAHEWTIIGDVAISLTTAGQQEDAVFLEFAKEITAKGVKKSLALSIGTAQVTSVQRKILADTLTSRKIPVAAVSDDTVVRGFVTAVSWLGVNIKAFSWKNLQDAIDHLKVDPAHVGAVFEAAQRLRTGYQARQK